MNRIDAALAALAELPVELDHWVRTMTDDTYLSIMFFGAVILTFVIARALR
jgi:hypothetical protein